MGSMPFLQKVLTFLLGDDLVHEVLEEVSSGVTRQGWNGTTIVLISKINKPEKVTELRPINLCTLVYIR
jgi:hypothetical protein